MKFPEILIAFRNAINSFLIIETGIFTTFITRLFQLSGLFQKNIPIINNTCVVLKCDMGKALPL